ncbi:uncharacterized protein LOC129742319 [Uranotaenia lowii]|uniref:uncharacterized protein LOC129742319 n=1 Tax=Uranotaenia lowii TaxID=190385 RepID=UPI00247A1CAC|nr:uncharacterized protein LOC129742319 [Uranotaenia lowii]
MSHELRVLVKREKQLNNIIESIEKFVENFHPETDQRQISVRLEKLENTCKEFYDVRGKIELFIEEAMEEESVDSAARGKGEDRTDDQSREEANNLLLQQFDDKFCMLKAELLELQIRDLPHNLTEHLARPSSTFSKVKLPEIRLPTFGGKVNEWVVFRDSFHSLIDQNSELTKMDKFTYLRAALSSDALQEINNIELSAANYTLAWNALQDRYENKKIIAKSYLDALFSIEPLKKESFEGLNRLINDFEKNVQMLEKIGEETKGWSTLLAHMICSRLDASTLRHWETKHATKEVPAYIPLMQFLKSQCAVLQSIGPQKNSSPHIDQRLQKSSVCHTMVKSSGTCPFCSESWHSAFQCGRFQRMKLVERNEAVVKARLCRNCLHWGHLARNCDRGSCHQCHQRHHTLLHPQVRSSGTFAPRPNQSGIPLPRNHQASQPKPQITNPTSHTNTSQPVSLQNSSTPNNNTSATPHTSQTYITLPITPSQNIILPTAIININDKLGNPVQARALLDSCSQNCLMTSNFAKKLKIRETSAHLSIRGIGSSEAVSTRVVRAEVAARCPTISPYSEEMSFHVLPKLTVALPTTSFEPSQLMLPDSTILADPLFFRSNPVDVIIGAEFYFDLMTEGRLKVAETGPTLQNTVFGWIVSGRIPNCEPRGQLSSSYVTSIADIQDQLTKFWELETCRTKSVFSIEETMCEEIFDATTTTYSSGRYVVSLPKKTFMLSRLGDSRVAAEKRFASLEHKLSRNEELKLSYVEFMREFISLGHMREVVCDTAVTPYYMPHHAVLKPESTTTKLRVVFDASCASSTGVSLNDALLVGPVIQDELIDIVLRFRLHRLAIVADIAKMYRMIRVQEEDCQLQRVLWRENAKDPLKSFEMPTVTYGTASAPYLATKCLQRLGVEAEKEHPESAKVISKDFYIDDMLTGVATVEEGRVLISNLVKLMESRGFQLRKFNSNCREILDDLPEELHDEKALLEIDNAAVKTLGLVWEPATDHFQFRSPKWNSSTIITKRVVLSDVARIFDPLGLVGPVVVQAKIFFQSLWKLNCGWDEHLGEEMQEQWHEYRRNLGGLEGLSVPRWLAISLNSVSVQIHGFCDASDKAYGACIYIRTVDEAGNIEVRLLTSKSRVAPLENLKTMKQKQSTPRLELSSALTLAHLYEKIKNALGIQAKAYFYTDSMIVKYWLSSTPSRWKEFVANRVSEIQHATRGSLWSHTPGIENPADIISRGMTPAQLQYQSLWFNGPQWLKHDETHWPSAQPVQEGEIDSRILQEKGAVVAVAQQISTSELFSICSMDSSVCI